MSLLHLRKSVRNLPLKNPIDPELYRPLYPYNRISRISFDDSYIMPRPADPMFITDTTFRDGQQARPPYTVKQIGDMFDMIYRLGGMSGLIRASEFFLYTEKDRRAVEECMSRGYEFPKITGWIRANKDDLKLVKAIGLQETGMLTSVSDYHIYLKLNKTREQAMRGYLEVVDAALELGITPRCHFEDITRADIHGFCLPFAQELMKRSKESGLPVKIRLCDTMGYGVPYEGAALPRSVGRIVRAFTDEAEVPGEWLEWHGHNDFHKAMVNGVTAWMYGCGGVNGTLLGFGERTGNTPVEALIIEYIQLTGQDHMAQPRVIDEISHYFERELEYRIPHNYPFCGRDFNATSAGVHVDGLNKNQEIYNIFDTERILGRSVPIIITDKSGKAGVAYWINQSLELTGDLAVDKRHPAIDSIHKRIQKAYAKGRTTSFSNKEMKALVKRYMPELFASEFDHLKQVAHQLAARLISRLADTCHIQGVEPNLTKNCMSNFLHDYPFIQWLYVVDLDGKLLVHQANPRNEQEFNKLDPDTTYTDREWFKRPLETGKLHVTDFYLSQFTGKLCLTVSAPVENEEEDIQGILSADIRFEELLKRQDDLKYQQSWE